ncbi:MAG: alpha/beta fold hydrolase [Dehalococcoidia bacterium]
MKHTITAALLILCLVASMLSGCVHRLVAEFEVTDLTLSKSTIEAGESATATVTLKNVGEASGSYEVELTVNGDVYDAKEVTVEPGKSKSVPFTISFQKEEKYRIGAGQKQVTATVAAAGPPAPQESAAAFLKLLNDGEFEGAVERFDETMKNALPASTLEELWQQLTTQSGSLTSLGESAVTEQSGYQVVVQRCVFENGELNAQVAFDKSGKIAGLQFMPATPIAEGYTPPDYANMGTFVEREVTFGLEGWELPGTLTVPAGERSFPAVVLVHGSGPNDRDETVGANKPFKDLAWGLASNGIAVLRYEKRTKQYPSKVQEMINGLTLKEEITEDAIAAVDFLSKTKGIEPDGIFVLGHSLGASVAPRIAAQEEQVAGLILLAATTRNLPDLMMEQNQYLAELDGKVTETEQQQLDQIEQLVQKVKELDMGEDEVILGEARAYWEDVMSYDPVETAKGLTVPMLILQGERDYQVPVEDFQSWKEGLAGQERVQLKLYPGLNHLFIAGEGPSSPAEYNQPGNVAETVIDDIAAWIKER